MALSTKKNKSKNKRQMEDKKQAEDFIKLNAALNVVNNSILHGNKKTIGHLPHRINLQKLGDLLKYSSASFSIASLNSVSMGLGFGMAFK